MKNASYLLTYGFFKVFESQTDLEVEFINNQKLKLFLF